MTDSTYSASTSHRVDARSQVVKLRSEQYQTVPSVPLCLIKCRYSSAASDLDEVYAYSLFIWIIIEWRNQS